MRIYEVKSQGKGRRKKAAQRKRVKRPWYDADAGIGLKL